MTTAQLVAAVIAILAILAPIGATVAYRVRQLEIKVMNGLSEEMAEMKEEFSEVKKELTRIRVLYVQQIEQGRGG